MHIKPLDYVTVKVKRIHNAHRILYILNCLGNKNKPEMYRGVCGKENLSLA